MIVVAIRFFINQTNVYIIFIITLNLFYVACTVIFVISFSYVCRTKSPTGLMFVVYHIQR